MFGLFGSKKPLKPSGHDVERADWETFLDQVYVKTIQGKAGGIAVISNTVRNNSKDVEGHVAEELTYRLKRNIDQKQGLQVRKFDYGKFQQVFEGFSRNSDQTFFRTRQVLPAEVLVFPLFQGEKRALVILEATLPEPNLKRALANIESEMRKA